IRARRQLYKFFTILFRLNINALQSQTIIINNQTARPAKKDDNSPLIGNDPSRFQASLLTTNETESDPLIRCFSSAPSTSIRLSFSAPSPNRSFSFSRKSGLP